MKKLIVMRAISGAGKTTYINKNFPDALVVSADHYFSRGGEYRFDATMLGVAHKACMRRFLELVAQERDIVVDNTNINIEDIAPYVAVGEACDYDVEIVQLSCDPYLAAKRNIHQVPERSVLNMHHRLCNTHLPKRWKVKVVTQGDAT